MKLFLLRHGLAVERGSPGFEDDFIRPLTAKGRHQLRQSCAGLKKLGVKFDQLLASPLIRARETSAIVAAELKCAPRRCRLSENLRPGAEPARLVTELKALGSGPEKILLVGHEPDLSRLIALLVTGKIAGGFELKKGGLAKLEIAHLRAGRCAVLKWMVTPKILAAIQDAADL